MVRPAASQTRHLLARISGSAILSIGSLALLLGLLGGLILRLHRGERPDPVTPRLGSWSQITEKVAPSVVSVVAVRIPLQWIPGAFSPWNSNVPSELAPRMIGIGSGVVLDQKKGILVTNAHVVENTEKVEVQLSEREKVKAVVIGVDPLTDLAVLQVPALPPTTPAIALGDSNQASTGDAVLAIGSPFGLSHTVTSGIISAKGRGAPLLLNSGAENEDLIQTDAAINPGNSGGPLLNTQGEMIGLNAAIFSLTGSFSGISFSVPSNTVKRITREILARGRVVRGWLGMAGQDLDEPLARFFNSPAFSTEGVLVSQIDPIGPAAATLRPGDLILTYQGRKIRDSRELRNAVQQTAPGSTVQVGLVREGRKLTESIQIQENPRALLSATTPPSPSPLPGEDKRSALNQWGLSLATLPPDLGELIAVPKNQGVLINGIQPGSPAFESGLLPGDILLELNRRELSPDVAAFERNLKDQSGALILYVQRGPEAHRFFISLRRPS